MNHVCSICAKFIILEESSISFNNISSHTICIATILILSKNKNLPFEIMLHIMPQLDGLFKQSQLIGSDAQLSNYTRHQKCSRCGGFPWKICFRCNSKVCKNCWNPFCSHRQRSLLTCHLCNKQCDVIFRCVSCRKNICVYHRGSGCSRISSCVNCTRYIYCDNPHKCYKYDHVVCKVCNNYGNTYDMVNIDSQYVHTHCGSSKLKKIMEILS